MDFLRTNKVKFTAEPGSFMTQGVLSIAMQITLARRCAGGIMHYFVDSGVHQGLTCQYKDNEHFKGHPIMTQSEFDKRIDQEQISFIWGQTCDGADYLTKASLLPLMHEREWILYRSVGAYNKEQACSFNSFDVHQVFNIPD